MGLLYKPDWEKTKQRYRAWWAHEYFGRCAIAVYAPKADAPEEDVPEPPADVEARWLDHDYLKRLNDFRLRHTYYGGEAFPIWTPGDPGWAAISVFLGGQVDLDEATAWIGPIIPEGELTDHDYNDLIIDPTNRWWKAALELTRLGAEESVGRAIPKLPAYGELGDTLASIRGANQLLLDVMDCPEYVRDFEIYLMKQWIDVYDLYHNITKDVAEGSTTWFPYWSPGRFYPVQNDFAYMISPKTFIDVFLPALEMQLDFLDHAVYHVDGIGNFAHVDALCELPNLQALQILPGAGKPSPLHYMNILKKVQRAGKNLHLDIPPDEVRPALENLSARGLFINTVCGSEAEANELIANCEKWSKDNG